MGLTHPSPNFGPRRDGACADMVVLHYTAMDSAEAALARLCDPQHEVSAHYLITRQGALYSLVPEDRRAWHAGAGRWGGVCDVNSRSIGIELDNRGAEPFAAPQMAALEALLAGLMARWAIPPERVIGHSDMAPGRKSDPGPRFDWQRLARQGLSVWPASQPPASPDAAAFAAAAHAFGYADDLLPDRLLAATRLRFAPHRSGPLTGAETAAMQDLARRFPVDRATPLT